MLDVSKLDCPRIDVLTPEEEKQLEGKSPEEIQAFLAQPEIAARTAAALRTAFGLPGDSSD